MVLQDFDKSINASFSKSRFCAPRQGTVHQVRHEHLIRFREVGRRSQGYLSNLPKSIRRPQFLANVAVNSRQVQTELRSAYIV
jgi:hypothetical protein